MLIEVLGAEASAFTWAEPAGVGFLEVTNDGVYDEAYFERYRDMSGTKIAVALNAFRVDLVTRHAWPGWTLLDVGIGDGAFLRACEDDRGAPWVDVAGCDVNPAAIAYLEKRGQLGSFEEPGGFDIVTFWDSLEHIRDPRIPLRAARRVALVSIPIFVDAADARASKHYRPDEHFWYFTRRGFVAFAEAQGFDVADILVTETALGRESIETFVLKRRAT